MFTWIFKLIKYDKIRDSYTNVEISDYYKEEEKSLVMFSVLKAVRKIEFLYSFFSTCF